MIYIIFNRYNHTSPGPGSCVVRAHGSRAGLACPHRRWPWAKARARRLAAGRRSPPASDVPHEFATIPPGRGPHEAAEFPPPECPSPTAGGACAARVAAGNGVRSGVHVRARAGRNERHTRHAGGAPHVADEPAPRATADGVAPRPLGCGHRRLRNGRSRRPGRDPDAVPPVHCRDPLAGANRHGPAERRRLACGRTRRTDRHCRAVAGGEGRPERVDRRLQLPWHQRGQQPLSLHPRIGTSQSDDRSTRRPGGRRRLVGHVGGHRHAVRTGRGGPTAPRRTSPRWDCPA